VNEYITLAKIIKNTKRLNHDKKLDEKSYRRYQSIHIKATLDYFVRNASLLGWV